MVVLEIVFVYSRSPPYSSSVSSEKAAEVWLISSLVYYNFLWPCGLLFLWSVRLRSITWHSLPPSLPHSPDIEIIHQMPVWGCISTHNSFCQCCSKISGCAICVRPWAENLFKLEGWQIWHPICFYYVTVKHLLPQRAHDACKSVFSYFGQDWS